MKPSEPITNVRIRVVFAEEIAALGGQVSDTFDQDDRLYLRAVLPRYAEVGHRDSVQCGVALRSVSGAVQIHPYTFRLVCENGAISAHALQTCHVARAASNAEALLRESVRVCGSEKAFQMSAGEMRQAQNLEADLAIQMMSLLARLPHTVQQQMAQQVMEGFLVGGDTTRFGLMNAITATARDTEDPELRWQLEEFGGGVPVAPNPRPVRTGSAALSLEAAWRKEAPALDTLAHEWREQELVAV